MRGFTLFEVVLVLILLSFILGFGFYYLNQLNQANFIFEESLRLSLNLAKIAREKSLLGEENATWGVGFINSSTLVKLQIVKNNFSNVYSQFDLPRSVTFVDPADNSSKYVFFEKFTGKTTSTKVSLKSKITNVLKYLCFPTTSPPFISSNSTCSEF